MLTFVNITIAIIWLFWKKSEISKLEKLPKTDWKITEYHDVIIGGQKKD